MSDIAPSIWTMLPSEITLMVVERACYSSKNTCLSLCRVCSWTRLVAERILYESVFIRSPESFHAFHASRGLVHTKSFCIGRENNLYGDVSAILDICERAKQLQHMSIEFWLMESLMGHTAFAQAFKCVSMVILTEDEDIDWNPAETMILGHPLACGSVTHLEFDGGLNPFFVDCEVQKIFPCLTHLAWTFERSLEAADSLRRAFSGGDDDQLCAPTDGQLFIIHIVQRLNFQLEYRAGLQDICESSIIALGWPAQSWIVMMYDYTPRLSIRGRDIWSRAKERIALTGYPGETKRGLDSVP